MLKIGLIVGREWSFPQAFIDAVAHRNEEVVAELVKLGGTRVDDLSPYAVIVDRLSHQVPYYRSHLKQAMLLGVVVVNNPFLQSADDRLVGAALAAKLGIPAPKTIALPNREYGPGIKHDESLRNLRYPLDWQAIIDYVGLPCILRDAHTDGRDASICRSLTDLIHHYNASGLNTMIAQEFIEWDAFVRCLAIGKRDILPMPYEPREQRWVDQPLAPDLAARIENDSRTLMRTLGYDLCGLEWAVRDGVPCVVDFMNGAPDLEAASLPAHAFEWAVERLADLTIRLAKAKPAPRDLTGGAFLLGSRGVDANAS